MSVPKHTVPRVLDQRDRGDPQHEREPEGADQDRHTCTCVRVRVHLERDHGEYEEGGNEPDGPATMQE